MPTLDDALDERDRLMRNYHRAKRAQLAELYADQAHGDRLRKFVASLNHFSIEHAERMLDYIEREATKWLSAAPVDIRHAALEAIDNRCIAIRRKAGLPEFEDPMPWDEPNVFFAAKQVLGL